MTAHAEVPAAAGAVPAGQMRTTALFLPLFAPFGISSGYVSVTLGFLLHRAGLSVATVATLVALSVWPQTWKVFWAPIVDTVGNPKLWYGLGAALVGTTILAMSVLPATRAELTALAVLVLLSSVASTLVSMSTEVFMAHCVAPDAQGSASGWAMAGNLGGAGIGGGLGLTLAEHAGTPWVSGAVLGAICFACWAAVLALPPAPRGQRQGSYVAALVEVGRDVWKVAKSRLGYLALILMLLPIASGGVSWSAIAGEWRAGADLVALVNGVAGGLVSAVGCLIGGYVCGRMDVKRAYALFGILCGVAAVTMAWLPRTPTNFVTFTMLYALTTGSGYAAYSAVVLEAIGKGAAATKFNLFSALSNVPIAAMTTWDGIIHDRLGTRVMLYFELAAPAATLTLFAGFAHLTRPRRA
ncbi:MAG: MFS transporter [Novosphingobium sp.]|nr:MFS transporter [Novosphingobium sp.]